MTRLPILTLVLLASMPIHAQSVDADQLYAQGVASRQAGDPQRALQSLEPLVAAQPQNTDALVQLGLTYLQLDRLEDAERAFTRTLELAPAYQDARLGLARIAARRNDGANARRLVDEVLAADPANGEARELLAQLTMPQPEQRRWRLGLEGNYSDLDAPQPDWREGAVRLGYRASPDLLVQGSVEASRRFDLTDVYSEARLDFGLAGRVSGYAALGFTPSAEFRPEWQLSLGGNARLRAGQNPTHARLDFRQSRFAVGDIQTVTPGIEQYVADGRAWLTAQWINIFDEHGTHSNGWLLRGDVMASDAMRLFGGYADAPDTSAGFVIDTKTVFGGAAIDLGERCRLSLSAAHEDRSTGFDRTQFSLGLDVEF